MKFLITTILLVFCIVLHGQTVLNIHVSDPQKRPISQAIIKHESSTFVSNNAGLVRISAYKVGSKILVHKFGFADTNLVVRSLTSKDTLEIFVTLRLNPMNLPEVSISSAPQEINPLKSDFVLGYELKGEYMIELLSDDILLVINSENVVKSRSRPVRDARDIVKDASGDIYLLTEKEAFKLIIDKSGTRVDTLAADLKKVNWNLKYRDEVTERFNVIRRYKDNNQTVAFFAMSTLNANHVKMLKEISNEDRKRTVAFFADESNSFAAYLESLGISLGTASTDKELGLVRQAEHMANMVEMHYALPYYSFLKRVNNNFYLFAHDLDSMFVYDMGCNLVDSKRINYHHLKIWGKELLVNEEKTKVYAKLLVNAKPVLGEIDLQTGALKAGFVTIEGRFPSRIRIRNNRAYFMTKKNNSPGFTVYSKSLE